MNRVKAKYQRLAFAALTFALVWLFLLPVQAFAEEGIDDSVVPQVTSTEGSAGESGSADPVQTDTSGSSADVPVGSDEPTPSTQTESTETESTETESTETESTETESTETESTETESTETESTETESTEAESTETESTETESTETESAETESTENESGETESTETEEAVELELVETNTAMAQAANEAAKDDGSDAQLATKLSKYVEEKIIDSKRIVTNEKGVAVYDKLPLGLYFVKQVNVVEGFTVCTPFLVTVPMKSDTGFTYDINATPKTDIAKLVTITVKKEWVADKSKIPSSVTVELLKDGKVIETATLTESKDWTATFEKMPEGSYDLKEVSVPKGFESKVVKKGYHFTVTNKYILAQTGQLVWPIPVFALAGILFLMAGFVILRKPGKQDA